MPDRAPLMSLLLGSWMMESCCLGVLVGGVGGSGSEARLVWTRGEWDVLGFDDGDGDGNGNGNVGKRTWSCMLRV